jgi:DNA-directed RNA polymerases I, II, and III subunit RPABC1
MSSWDHWKLEVSVLERMLRDRCYTNFRSICHGDDPILLCSCRNEKGEAVLAYLCQDAKVRVSTLRKMRAESEGLGCKHMILLAQDGLTAFAARELTEKQGTEDVEIFKKSDLALSILRHRLVPRHEVLTPARKKQLLQGLACKGSSLPKLKETDAVARYLHLAPGTVVQIHRQIGTMEAEPYFRIVV